MSVAELKSFEASVVDHDAPVSHRLDADHLARHRIIGFDPTNEQAPPFLVLRSQLLKHARTATMRSFAVTSVQPGNGKSHIALNLAAVLSRLQPTILIELDLRRPTTGIRLDIDPEHPGIDDVLNAEADLRSAAIRIADSQLTVYRVRRPRMDAEQLLASPRFRDVMEEIAAINGRSIQIVDTPPAFVHDDLVLVTRCIDGILMVVEEARTSKRALQDAISALLPTPIVGSILNKSISAPSQESYYEYYSGPSDAAI